MYDLNLIVPDITSKKYSNDNRFLLLKNYLYELNETLSHALEVRNFSEVSELGEKLASANKIQQESLAMLSSVSSAKNNQDKETVKKLQCQNTEKSKNLVSDVVLFENSGFVWVNIRFEAVTELAPDVTHTVAIIPEKAPGIFTPLNSFANFSSGGQSTGGVVYKSGEVVLRSDTAIAPGTLVYISGFYKV